MRLVVLILAFGVAGAAASERIERLNTGFLRHLDALATGQPLAVEAVRRGWTETYASRMPASFVPDALAVLNPAFRDALLAFDGGRSTDTVQLATPLLGEADPYLRANATWLVARSLADLGLLEEAEALLATGADDWPAHTPFAPQLLFLRAHCQAANLRVGEALATLAELRAAYDDAPEAVTVGARQLSLELERRERGNLAEVAGLMGYSADRLAVQDSGTRVRSQQQRALDMLDQLIEEQEQQEGQGGGSSSGQQQAAGGAGGQGAPQTGRERSEVAPGQGEIGKLTEGQRANPGEMWGKLPPEERERILQSLRERFPSRYRELVEQYYRSLAEGK